MPPFFLRINPQQAVKTITHSTQVEWEKELEGENFENFLLEIKAPYGKQKLCAEAKQRSSFTASHGHAGIQPSLGKQCSITHNHYLGRQALVTYIPCIFPPAFVFEHNIIWYGMSSWSAGVSYPCCVLFQLLVHPSLLAGGMV